MQLDVQKEVDRLIAECRAHGSDYAARHLVDNGTTVIEIATRARLELKTRDLPSPFVYSRP